MRLRRARSRRTGTASDAAPCAATNPTRPILHQSDANWNPNAVPHTLARECLLARGVFPRCQLEIVRWRNGLVNALMRKQAFATLCGLALATLFASSALAQGAQTLAAFAQPGPRSVQTMSVSGF